MRLKSLIDEAFKDMGNLKDEELLKGQKLDPKAEPKENFTKVEGRIFHQAISKLKENDLTKGDKARGLDTLSTYKIEDYQKMKCYLGNNNSSGFAINNGDLVTVFSTQKSSGSAIVQAAIKNGAKTLDCFATLNNCEISGDLYRLYSKNGFKIDTSKNTGKMPCEPYAINKGISFYVDDSGKVDITNPQVVIFMKV